MSTIQRIDLSSLRWQDSRARECILRGGSKAGTYEYLYETQPTLRKHLPTDSHTLEHSADIEHFLSQVDFSKAKAVRGCHPLDFVGMVDVIPTGFTEGIDGVRSDIHEILEAANSSEVRRFMEYETGKPYDGKIIVFVQDKCGSGVRGSIIEHPHEKGIYRIGQVTKEGLRENVSEICCSNDARMINNRDSKKDKLVFKPDDGFVVFTKDQVKRIINLYEAIKDSGLIPEGYSFQMECGIGWTTNEVMFYQARLFKPFQERASFDVLDIYNGLDLSIKDKTLQYDVFGVTPEMGIELGLVELNEESLVKYSSRKEMAYGCNLSGEHKGTPLNIMPENLVAYFPDRPEVLGHGNYRWLQKADYGLIAVRKKIKESIQSLDEEIKVRIYSDGIRGLVCLVKK